MHVQSDIPHQAAQAAPPEITQLEETCGRMIREHGSLRKQLALLQARSNVQEGALRDEAKRRRHAERMQAAVELRLDDLENQNEELLTAVEGLVESFDSPQTYDHAVVMTMRFEAARKIVKLYGAKSAAGSAL